MPTFRSKFHTLGQIHEFGENRYTKNMLQIKTKINTKTNIKMKTETKINTKTKTKKEQWLNLLSSLKFDETNITNFNYNDDWYCARLEKYNPEFNNLDKIFIFSEKDKMLSHYGKYGDFIFEFHQK